MVFEDGVEFEEGMDLDFEENDGIKFDIIKNDFLSKVDESSKKAFMKYLTNHMQKKVEEENKFTQVYQIFYLGGGGEFKTFSFLVKFYFMNFKIMIFLIFIIHVN